MEDRRPRPQAAILRKLGMAATGLFLTLFLVVHMLGNLQLFLPEATARPSFNAYSAALTSSLPIKLAGWATYAAVLGHALLSALVWRRNRRGRPRGYARERPSASSPWYARSMGWLGVVTLSFLVWHMQTFWYRYHWGPIGRDAHGHKDLYTVVVTAFGQPWIVVLYVLAMIALGFHLQHGLAAAVRSLGGYGAGLEARVPRLARGIAWTLVTPFVVMPVYVFLAFGGRAP